MDFEHRKVALRNPSDHAKLLTTSKTKLHSIEEIVRIESSALKSDLRCVVLTDFIRKSELPRSSGESTEFEDIGVVPIFETLKRAGIPNVRLGVLCGSLVIIPESSKERSFEQRQQSASNKRASHFKRCRATQITYSL